MRRRVRGGSSKEGVKGVWENGKEDEKEWGWFEKRYRIVYSHYRT